MKPFIVILKRDTLANWLEFNLVLALGEVARIEDEGRIDHGRFKVGDGKSRWSQLPFTDRLPLKIVMPR